MRPLPKPIAQQATRKSISKVHVKSFHPYRASTSCQVLTSNTMDVDAGSRTNLLEQRKLCEYCTYVNLHDLKSSQGYEHQPTWASLLLSSHHCALCKLLAQSMQRSLNQGNAPQQSLDTNNGPVRLVAAGRTVPSQSNGRSFTQGAVDESLLWREVGLVVGGDVKRHGCFFPLNTQVLMVAAHGEYRRDILLTKRPNFSCKARQLKALAFRASSSIPGLP